MRVTLCNEVIRELDLPGQFAFASSVGYDGLELAPFTLDPEPHRLSSGRRAAIRRAASDAGLAITGLHWLLLAPQGLSITSEEDAVFAHTLEVGRGLVNLCAELGGAYLVHGSPDQRRLQPGREREGRGRAMDYLSAVARAAEAAGVTYILEPLSPSQTNFVQSVAEAVDIVREIGNLYLRTMIDCSAAGASEAESIPDLVARWFPTGLLAHIHFNDPNRRGPGEGDLAFAPIVAALAQGGYTGVIGVEPFVYEPDGPACAARAIGYIRGLLEDRA
jgi:D-psicose/D-tagatose/L-ribulose 3-epimerase